MVCIAAFIILAIIGIFVAIISIFKREVGKKYLQMLKKSWGCLGKKIRLQKCETGFKEDVKNTLLSRVIIKHPTWIKPLNVIIEVVSVVIVVVAAWALLTAIKSLLALWALGTCNVTKPAACSLSAEVCSIDESEPSNVFEATGRWFEEWGEIFSVIPDKFRDFNPDNFDFYTFDVRTNEQATAIDILDPGCSVCMASYLNQKSSGFFEKYNVKIVLFAIKNPDGNFKFKNSDLIVRTAYALNEYKPYLTISLLDRILATRDETGTNFQSRFNNDYDHDEAIKRLSQFMRELGLSDAEITNIHTAAESEHISELVEKNRNIVENDLRLKGIPTMLYDGKKHTGLFEAQE